ncbi:type II toxin-antitoxin system PemK/MazF family toxin [Actinopolymorpha alba]|uniref:type II toxin-antitoxin system PemK/MazF family toxin n=1 Tax=Actinopolymorpha alba TaxID=533267 RepID=UPI00037388AA|nr:type II toxin-antitoxin system PemK/MazF family toxin [Actinopolymorpha alba]
MRRGEIWRYVSKGFGRERLVVVVSTDAINGSPGQGWFLALEVTPEDPGHLLAVELPGTGWVTPQQLDALYQRSCVEQAGLVEHDVMERVASMLRIALDL